MTIELGPCCPFGLLCQLDLSNSVQMDENLGRRTQNQGYKTNQSIEIDNRAREMRS